MGTRINNLQVTKVTDGDTINVSLNSQEERIRVACVDTEESAGSKPPITKAGKAASKMAKDYFKDEQGNLVSVDLEFDTDDTFDACLEKHRDKYERLICYVHKDSENFSLKLIKEGWSPYFVKYGRSRIYHKEFLKAEAEAQTYNSIIWDPATNEGGESRDYKELIPYWEMRALAVEDYRNYGIPAGVLSVRLNYGDLLAAIESNSQIKVFCDLQGKIQKFWNVGFRIEDGNEKYPFCLWIPDPNSENSKLIIQLIQKRYLDYKREYVFVSGKVVNYKGTPEIILTDVNQISDLP